MTTSTQKLFLIVFMMNIIIGTALTIYQQPTFYQPGQFKKVYNYTDYELKKTSVYSTPETTDSTYQVQETPLDSFKASSVIWSIGINSLKPWIVIPADFSPLEEMFIMVINIVRVMLMLLLSLEIYLVLINKKT